MKSNLKKTIAIIVVILICAAATVFGFAVSAATHSNAAFTYSVETTDNFSRTALKDGVWQAVYEDGHSMYFFISERENSLSIINPDKGIGVASRYEYIPAIGLYQMHIGSESNELSWRIIDNNGCVASVSDENDEILTLYYISDKTVESYQYYTYTQLSDMARACYENQRGSADGVTFIVRLKTDGSNLAVINAQKNGNIRASYIIDIQNGAGTDNMYHTVDLSEYASDTDNYS